MASISCDYDIYFDTFDAAIMRLITYIDLILAHYFAQYNGRRPRVALHSMMAI